MAVPAPHPGVTIRRDCLERLGLSVTHAAAILGVTRQALSRVVNGRAGVSLEMAIRLAKAFGGTPESWLRLQLAYDLAQAEKRAAAIKIRRYEPPQMGLFAAEARKTAQR